MTGTSRTSQNAPVSSGMTATRNLCRRWLFLIVGVLAARRLATPSRHQPPATKHRTIEQELLEVMESSSRKVLSRVVLSRARDWLRLGRGIVGSVGSAAILGIAVWLLSSLISWLTQQEMARDEMWILAFPSSLMATSVWLVDFVEERIFTNQIAHVLRLPEEEAGFRALIGWFRRTFSWVRQLIFSALFGFVGVISIKEILSARYAQFADNLGVDFAVFSAMAAIANGAYFALAIPTVAKVASQHRLNLYPLDPARSFAVRLASRTFGQLTLFTGIAASLIMVSILLLEPWTRSATFGIAILWLLFVWIVTSHTFVLPIHFVNRAIAEEKRLQLDRLDRNISPLHGRLERLSIDELDRLHTLNELRERLARATTWPVPIDAWIRYFTSLMAPAASLLVGFHSEISQWLQSIGSA